MRSAHPAEVNPTAEWRIATFKARSWIWRAARRCRRSRAVRADAPGTWHVPANPAGSVRERRQRRTGVTRRSDDHRARQAGVRD
jgi:hypothetical protein